MAGNSSFWVEDEANLRMIADDEFIAWLGREIRCLRQVVEPTIDNPELSPVPVRRQ